MCELSDWSKNDWKDGRYLKEKWTKNWGAIVRRKRNIKKGEGPDITVDLIGFYDGMGNSLTNKECLPDVE